MNEIWGIAMCGGLAFNQKDKSTGGLKLKKVFFPIPQVHIPVIEAGMDPDDPVMMQWGRRHGEDPEFSSYELPVTGWARLSSLVEGKWNHYQPSKVRIPLVSWMEKDPEKKSHWFDVEPHQYLLGVKIQKHEKNYVYIVTKTASEAFQAIHNREPLLVGL
jgi:hypothetical protein